MFANDRPLLIMGKHRGKTRLIYLGVLVIIYQMIAQTTMVYKYVFLMPSATMPIKAACGHSG
jgi:hypothetical protein